MKIRLALVMCVIALSALGQQTAIEHVREICPHPRCSYDDQRRLESCEQGAISDRAWCDALEKRLIAYGSTPAVKQIHQCPSGETWNDENGVCAADYSLAIQQQEADKKAHAGYYEQPTVKHPVSPKHFKAPATTTPRYNDVPAVPAVATTPTTTSSSDSSSGMAVSIVLFCIVLYFLPSLAGYKKRNAGAIFALNLFLGWTLIGWIVAFVWASTKDAPEPVSEETMREYLAEIRKKEGQVR